MSIGGSARLPGLKTAWLGREIHYFEDVDSTNSWLKERAAVLPHGVVCMAASQTAGRGRMGRGWQDIPSAGLPLSFLLAGWKPEQMAALPLAVGLAVAKAVERHCAVTPKIKWSNDLLLGGRKFCGILCESRSAAGREDSVLVVGLGLNLTHNRAQLDALGLVYATSLFLETRKNEEPFSLAAQILNETEPILEEFREKGFSPFRQDYAARCVTLGREIRVIAPDGSERTGTALDISDTGDLICSIGGHVEEVRAGEVSVRGLYGYV